jgi:hypothetical protein
MSEIDRLDDEDTALELTDSQIRWVARRQLIASLVMLAIIAAIAGLVAVRPGRVDTAAAVSNRLAGIQKPSFAPEPGNRLSALKQRPVELP